MTNVLTIQENRNFIEKAKNKMQEIRQQYQEKIIDTGKSQKLEAMIEAQAERKKKTIKIAGTIATVVLMACPADGVVGEIASALTTPGLCALVNITADIKKKLLITGKRAGEKFLFGVDGSNENVKGYDLTNQEFVEDARELVSDLNQFDIGRSK